MSHRHQGRCRSSAIAANWRRPSLPWQSPAPPTASTAASRAFSVSTYPSRCARGRAWRAKAEERPARTRLSVRFGLMRLSFEADWRVSPHASCRLIAGGPPSFPLLLGGPPYQAQKRDADACPLVDHRRDDNWHRHYSGVRAARLLAPLANDPPPSAQFCGRFCPRGGAQGLGAGEPDVR